MDNSGETEFDVDLEYPDEVDVDDVVATLTLRQNDKYMKTISLRRGHGDQIFVGRYALGKDQQYVRLQINDPVVSKDQFRIYTVVYDDDDFTSYMFYLEDLETLNGTDVNGFTIGSRSKPGLPFLLTNGDEIFVQPNWKLKFQQNAGSRKEKLEVMQREDSLFFKDRYHISNRFLGGGQFSKVMLGHDVQTKKQLACKVMDLTKVKNDSRELERLIDEVRMLGKLNHPNIVTLQKAFRSHHSLFLFLDLAPGGDLMSFVNSYGGMLSDTYTLVIVRQVTLAVDYLHDQGIVHRDLKPENILVMHNDIGHRVIVADFGCASVIRSSNAKRMDSYVGTANYLAPEVHSERRREEGGSYTKAVDLWSLGVLTFTLLTGENMIDFEKRVIDQTAVQERLKMPGYDIASDQRWDEVTAFAKDFIARLLVVDPHKRMSAKEAAKHDWFTRDKKLARELDQLYERANKDWKPRIVEKSLLETIPGVSQDSQEEAPPRARRAPNTNASPYFGLDKHLHSYGTSQRQEAARTKQMLIDQLKESGETFFQTNYVSTYTPQKPKPNSKFPLTSQDITARPLTPRGPRPRVPTPRTPTKGYQKRVIREVDAKNMFADTIEEASSYSPSENRLRESQITTQAEDESHIPFSPIDTQASMPLAVDDLESLSLTLDDTRPVRSFSSAPFSTICSLSIRKKTPEPEPILRPESAGGSMEIEELLQQQFSSVDTNKPMPTSNTDRMLTAKIEKRKLHVYEVEEDEVVVNPEAIKRRVPARHSTLTQEEKDLRKDILKSLPQFTSAKKYGQQIKERKQGILTFKKGGEAR